MYYVNIKSVELPVSVRGVTAIKDGTYYIFINSIYDLETKNEILKEELLNIKDFSIEDFEKYKLEGEIVGIRKD